MPPRAHIELEQLKRAVRLSDLVGARVKLRKRGKEWSGRCPFHDEKHASFAVYDDTGQFHCFGCGAHGDHVSWLMQAEGMTFGEAVERLGGTRTGDVARHYADHKARQEAAESRSMAHWNAALPLDHPFAAMWLRVSYGLSGPYSDAVRWAAAPYHGGPLPLVAQVVDAGGEAVAAYLNRIHGTVGKCRDGAVRCGEARSTMALTASLVGALWVHEQYGVPCWCALCEDRLGTVWLPEICTGLTIFAGIGEHSWRLAMNAADHFETTVRRVVIEPLGDRIDGEAISR